MSETSESKRPEADSKDQSSEVSVDAAKATEGAATSADPPASGVAEPDPLEKAQAEAQRMKDNWIRTTADFDNFRKRSRKEIEDARKAGREELLRELLPVFDNLERGIQSAQRAQDVKALAEGLVMVHKQFDTTLARSGITKVATVGQSFDPTLHEAIQQVETEEHPPGTIVSEVQAGYLNGERLIRAALVVVAKAKAAPEGSDGATGQGGEASN